MGCNVHLKFSRFLAACTVLMYGGGLSLGLALWCQLPWGPLRVFLSFLIGYSFHSFYYVWCYFVTKQAKAAILTITLDNGQWFIQTREGEAWQGELLKGSVVGPPVLFLRFRPLDGGQKRLAMVTADSVSSREAWHQCCQCLRVMYAKDPLPP